MVFTLSWSNFHSKTLGAGIAYTYIINNTPEDIQTVEASKAQAFCCPR